MQCGWDNLLHAAVPCERRAFSCKGDPATCCREYLRVERSSASPTLCPLFRGSADLQPPEQVLQWAGRTHAHRAHASAQYTDKVQYHCTAWFPAQLLAPSSHINSTVQYSKLCCWLCRKEE